LEAAECGATCLGIVLAYHGRWVPLEELRLACGVNRNGSKASNILKAARAFGLAAKGFGKSPAGLMDLPRPSIIQWKFNQFVVFEGMGGGRAWLNDPATGRRSCSVEELEDRYNGVVLAMEPRPGFKPGGPRPRQLGALFQLLGGSRGAVLLIALFSLLLVLPGVLLPGLARLFVDKVLADQLTAWVLPLCLTLLAAGGFQALVTWLQLHYLQRLEAKLSAVLSARVMARMLALPLAFISQRSPAELAGRVASADAVAAVLSGQVAGTAFNLMAVLAYGLAMAMYDPLVAAVGLMVPVANLLVLRRIGRQLQSLGQVVTQHQGMLGSITAGTILSIETLKVAGGEAEAFARWAGHHAQAAGAERSIGAINAAASVSPVFLQALGAAVVLVVGGLRVMEGALTIGSLLALQMLLASLNAPFLKLLGVMERLRQVRGDLARVSNLLNQPPAAPPPPPRAPDGTGRLELRDVTFGYSRTDPPLIEGLSLTIEPGRRVALVGASGSGKSTLGRLIAGLLEPWSGEILFDGRPLAAIPPAERASVMSYVDQEVFLFAGSVRDNLTLWDETVPEAVLVEALKDAGLHADVASRPGGLDTEVAEAGANFSGGQRQRLEIARALVANPAALVLDEATAALDPIVELQIDAALRRRGCSCVIIAHRLSTIRDADEILLMELGQVAERGPHTALLAAGGLYSRLLEAAA
jgi:NHLM bacteriocin system ABC transporter peptidase/ATP-binding protein